MQPNIVQSTSEHVSESTCSYDTTHAHPNTSFYSTPMTDVHASSTTLAIKSQSLDTDTFPAYGTYLIPSEPNGTWRAHASHLSKNSKGNPLTFRKVMELHTQELDISGLRGKLEHIAVDRKDQLNDWLNQTFAEYDLVEMHGQVQRLIPRMPIPNLRHLDTAIDTVSDIAQSLRTRRHDSDLTKAQLGDNKWDKDQAIGDDWQLLEV